MQKTNTKPFDFILFITVIILLSIGIIMVLSASSPQSLSEWRKQLLLFKKTGNICSHRNYSNDSSIKNRL